MAAASVLALRRLKREGVKLSRDILLYLGADEEVGPGYGLEWMLAHRPELREAEFALNEGGPHRALHGPRAGCSSWRSRPPSASPATWCSRPPGPEATPPRRPRIPTRWSACPRRWHGSARSPSPPGSRPRPGCTSRAARPSTPGELGEALKRIAASPDAPPQEAVERVARLDPALAAVMRTTCTPTVFQAGTRPNVIPATAEATLNCRLLPDEDAQALQARLVAAVADPSDSSADEHAARPTRPCLRWETT